MREPRKPVPLGDVAAVALSGVDKHITPGEAIVRLCNYLDVYRHRRLTKDMPFSRGTARPAEIARFTLRKGDVLITKDSETPHDIGIPSVVADDLAGVICGYHLALLRPEGDIASNFLLHYLQSDSTKRHFLRTANGLTRFGLGMRAISSLPLPLPFPSSDEQATIADILDALDTALERTRAAVDRARQLHISTLSESFERLKAVRRRLGEFTSDVRYGTSQAANERDWGNPTLRIPNVVRDQLSLDDVTFVALRQSEVERLKLRDGDLLLVRTNGNPDYVGRSAVFRVPDDQTWLYASYLTSEFALCRVSRQTMSTLILAMNAGVENYCVVSLHLRETTTSIPIASVSFCCLFVPDDPEDQNRVVALAKAFQGRRSTLRENRLSLLRRLRLRLNQIRPKRRSSLTNSHRTAVPPAGRGARRKRPPILQ